MGFVQATPKDKKVVGTVHKGSRFKWLAVGNAPATPSNRMCTHFGRCLHSEGSCDAKDRLLFRRNALTTPAKMSDPRTR